MVSPLAVIALMVMIILATIALVAAAVLWIAGRRVEVKIRQIDSELSASTKSSR